MCPKSEGLEVKLFITTATSEWEAVKHFCQPHSALEAKKVLDQVVLGLGASVLQLVPEGVAFGVGLSAGKMTLLPPGPGEPDPFVLPEMLVPFTETFTWKHRRIGRGRRRPL